MTLRVHTSSYAIVRLDSNAEVPKWAKESSFWSVTQTPDELSVIAEERCVPASVDSTTGWTLFELVGTFDFAQTGILHELITPLAGEAIPVLAIATHNTDYLLIQSASQAQRVLEDAGHKVTRLAEPLRPLL